MKLFKTKMLLIGLVASLSLTNCNKEGKVNILSVEDDKKLGLQVRDEILNDPAQYPILDEAQYPDAYNYINALTTKILNSSEILYKEEFAWEVRIIQDDKTLNAFATPGGYIFVYTGLIKYLDTEDQLAGVLGHEIAHADRRHSSRNLTKIYGVSLLLEIIAGKNSSKTGEIATGIAQGLSSLKFSRDMENEADEYSVVYLSETSYQCSGAAGFFEKLKAEGNCDQGLAWTSTHPDPCDRIDAIHAKAKAISCSETPDPNANYANFQKSLP